LVHQLSLLSSSLDVAAVCPLYSAMVSKTVDLFLSECLSVNENVRLAKVLYTTYAHHINPHTTCLSDCIQFSRAVILATSLSAR